MDARTVTPLAKWTTADLQLIDDLACAEARESFWAFRRWIHGDLLLSWYQRDVARRLQRFYDDFVAGLRPKLVLAAPPQHGKSAQMIDFAAWVSGKNPDLKSIFGSYSEDLGIKANLTLQRIITSERYRMCFGATRISEVNVDSGARGRYLRNTNVLEFVNRTGSFRNTTVRGQITGQELDFGFVDDPIKGRMEASSRQNRDNVWNWLTDDFFTRFSERGALVMIMTRWHIDDPVGRFVEHFPETQEIKFTALAEQDERHRKAGDALFPELKSLEFLLERKKALSSASWQALYQQSPIVAGGDLFPVERFNIVTVIDRTQIKLSVRYWDKAGTQGGGAYTCGVLMHAMRNGRYLIEDVVRGQWSALERERRIKQTAVIDTSLVRVWVEQEPGSGGKESAENTIRMLAGYIVQKDRVTGAKAIRAEPYAAQVQGSNVDLLQGHWNRDFIDEHEVYPGRYVDQVDAAAGAFSKCAPMQMADTTWSWVG
jgi:predicted phage terminase large subunit-like protein